MLLLTFDIEDAKPSFHTRKLEGFASLSIRRKESSTMSRSMQLFIFFVSLL